MHADDMQVYKILLKATACVQPVSCYEAYKHIHTFPVDDQATQHHAY